MFRLPFSRASASVSVSVSRAFHSSRPLAVSQGDSIPDLDVLTENSPGNKVNLASELAKGKGVIVGTPGAFTPGCSLSHVPGFLNHPKLKDAGKVFVVSVNDAFVTKAWGESLDPQKKSGVRFLADASGEFNRQMDLLFSSAKVFGNDRSKRYALLVEDGKVVKAFVEPDNTSVDGIVSILPIFPHILTDRPL
ncbi:Peroxiredoxin [Trichophyton interdigitale]|uniref:Peroxiredoxin n=1 Tax=Trichophyton interdigitale TaxID=101480 RepID=A0A9P5D1J7_9EURO|nr:Peroxiredoxin [Trichophyton interdigitale]KAF3900673.1 Peroxiredoxin [Trichophyton interdigitale]KAG8211447.1 Peroxiredoxin [Trichophyton interdigitale]